MKKTTSGFCRIVSFCLAMVLLLTMLPAVPLITGSTASAANQKVTIYFRAPDSWGEVYGYVWDASGNNPLGGWPGSALSKDSSSGLYKLTVDFAATATNPLNFIFNNNKGSQTGDLKLTADQLATSSEWWMSGPSAKPVKYALPATDKGKVTFTYESATATNVYVAGSMNGWSTSANKMTKSGNVFTCSMELAPGQYDYKFVVDGEWILDPCNPQTIEDNNYFLVPGLRDMVLYALKGQSFTLPSEMTATTDDGRSLIKPVTYALKTAVSGVTLSGNTLTVSEAYTGSTVALTATAADGASCTVTVDVTGDLPETTKVTAHFINSLGWDGVCGYAWSGSLVQHWPGQTVRRGDDGTYTMVLEHAFNEGEDLQMLFHNCKGSQTTDITVTASQLSAGDVELWVQPKTTANSDGKYPVTVTTTLASQFLSTQIDGDKVTFRYKGTGTNVYLAGSFNDWSTSANKMTKSGSVFSTTVTLGAGIHEYKLVVDGNWIHDPGNGLTGGYDGNSVLVVPSGDEPVDDGKITVKLHYYRADGNYTGWDVWNWSEGQSGSAATFATVAGDKGRVATFTVDGRKNTNVGFIVRKGNWTSQEFGDRFIDLSDVTSGTVHYFVTKDVYACSRILDADVVMGGKLTGAHLDYDSGKIYAQLSMPYTGTLSTAFSIKGPDSSVTVEGVELSGGSYALSLSRDLTLGELPGYQVVVDGISCGIQVKDLFYSKKFAADYTYTGDDLGANWSAESTTFKVWAPTAKNVKLKIYTSGNWGAGTAQTVQMKLGDKGVWYVTVTGDLNGKYYNYDVTFDSYTVEATDPYARGCGANGDRGLIVDLRSTDPEGWENDISPNKGMSYTDAIIYEMHVREMTIDASSGVDSKYRGTYLGLTQTGTNYQGHATGLDHLKELGITHVQLMPVFDFNAIDEYKSVSQRRYEWGYDPKHFSCVEGGYSTDPFNGATRITEFKQMVQSFHRNGINVVMDVVYNHFFMGGDYCGNKIVPNYYSRFFGEGNWSNGSGCGNDTATERSMVRHMIVDSIMHWVEEYHIDGFRFDLAGLIDTQTINEIVNTVHAKYPHVIFYGEGWAAGGTAVEYGYDLATQGNAGKVPGFGFFNDGLRNAIAGDNGNSWGFATGSWDYEDAIANYFRASNGWSTDPNQTLNYVACHDNYCLMDKIIISKNGTAWADMVRMNNLSAAIYMMAQGVPFIYSGEELLREKKDSSGNRYDNTFGTTDYINKIRWSDLKTKDSAQMTDDYYAGLVAFRKNHAALRCPSGADAWNYVTYKRISDQTILFNISGYPNYECSDGIVIIYNAKSSSVNVDLSKYGVSSGKWTACVHGTQAGIDPLWSVDVSSSGGTVTVEGISATILVKGDLVDEDSVYNKNLELVTCDHQGHRQDGTCANCGASDAHVWTDGKCVCGKVCSHTISGGKCTVCGIQCATITKQPASVVVVSGQEAKVTVTATGDGLSYKWYYAEKGSSTFKLTTSFTGATYAVSMNASRNGRQVYCVVTDKYGNSVESDTVTLSMKTALKITRQPVSVKAYDGETAKVSFAVQGDGLTYQWYFAEAGSNAFKLTTSFKGRAYSVAMTAARSGRRVYCVITDKYGDSVQTDTVSLTRKLKPEITTQPKSVKVASGATAQVSLVAKGEGLTYKWYYASKGSSKFALTDSFTGTSYKVTMTAARNGRQVYCVVTDKYGTSVKSDVVTLGMRTELKITRQPASVKVAEGETAKVSFAVQGDGLTYKWYYANKGSTKYSYTSSFKGRAYRLSMTEARSGRKVYCVITDEYGNSVRTKTVSLNMRTPLKITAQPTAVKVAEGKTAKVTVTAQGDGLTYKWYYSDGSAFKTTTTFTGNYYSIKMNEARSGRKVYCVITDKYGDSVKTNTVTLSMK